METRVICLISNIFIPILIIVIGAFMQKRPPKEINGMIGYRTSRSRLSKETWNFAQLYSGKIFLISGMFMFVVSVAASIVSFAVSEDAAAHICVILCLVQVIIILLSIIPVEAALRKNFDQHGKRRS